MMIEIQLLIIHWCVINSHEPCPTVHFLLPSGYFLKISLLWNAHANVLLVTSSDLSHYLLKYTMKIEDTGTININTDLSQMLGLQGIPDSLAKTVAALTTSKPVSCQEAALQLLDIPIIQMSDDVVYKSTQPPGNRTKDINRLSRSQQAFKLNDIGLYENRPKTDFFENMKFIDYFEQYEIRKDKLARDNREVVARDAFNNYIYKRDQQIVVRTTRSHPACEDPEGFFFNILLQNCTFRSENEFTRGEYGDGHHDSYYKECRYSLPFFCTLCD